METRATTNGVQQHAQEQAYIEWREYHTKQSPMCVFYETKEHHGGIEYKEIFYSNDIVELKLIDHIIMENGETSIDKIHDFSIH